MMVLFLYSPNEKSSDVQLAFFFLFFFFFPSFFFPFFFSWETSRSYAGSAADLQNRLFARLSFLLRQRRMGHEGAGRG